MIERWLSAVRDHPERPPAMQRHVLTMLALRLSWKTGTGFVSTGQLATDADASESTVRRATQWARGNQLLIRTRRGHRLGNGQIAASEWKLSQPVTGDLLSKPQPVNGEISTGQQDDLNRSPQTHHQELSTSKGSSSASANGSSPTTADARKTSWPPVDPCEHCGEHFITWAMWNRYTNEEKQEARSGMYTCPKPGCRDAEEARDWTPAPRIRHDDPPAAAESIASLRQQMGWMKNAAAIERRWEIIAPGIGLVVGTADDMRAVAALLALDAELEDSNTQ